MNKNTSMLTRIAGVGGVLALCSTVAFGLPWDVDMADAQSVKGYEHEMVVPPADSIPQPNPLTPTRWVRDYTLGSPELATMTNPIEPTADTLRTGKRMYEVYCTPCHGDGQNLGKVSQHYPGIAILAGDSANARLRQVNDGRLYVTIRKGYGLMPAYGWAMNEPEIWSLIHHLRTLDNATYRAPAPKPTDEETP